MARTCQPELFVPFEWTYCRGRTESARGPDPDEFRISVPITSSSTDGSIQDTELTPVELEIYFKTAHPWVYTFVVLFLHKYRFVTRIGVRCWPS